SCTPGPPVASLPQLRDKGGLPRRIRGEGRWLKLSLLRTMNSLAQSSKQAHNQGMKTYAGIVLALAFCASAFASDPGKNAVARPILAKTRAGFHFPNKLACKFA